MTFLIWFAFLACAYLLSARWHRRYRRDVSRRWQRDHERWTNTRGEEGVNWTWPLER